jgi:hypothetical protein
MARALLLGCDALGKAYGTRRLFDDLSFGLFEGDPAPRPRAGALRGRRRRQRRGRGPDVAAEDDPSQEAGMRSDLVVGGHLPDLELPDHRREPVRLSKLAAGFPLIVSFYRGYW